MRLATLRSIRLGSLRRKTLADNRIQLAPPRQAPEEQSRPNLYLVFRLLFRFFKKNETKL